MPANIATARSICVAALKLSCCIGISANACAAGSLLLMDPPPEHSTLSGGATVRTWPSAPGASRGDVSLLPALDYATPNGAFVSTDTGVGWNLAPFFMDEQGVKQWQWGARLWPQFGRPARETPRGMEPLGTRITTEAFANVQALPYLLVQSGLSWGSGRHHDGAQLEFGVTSGLPLGSDLLGVGLAATYANAAHLRSYFGVQSGEAAASGLRTWKPGNGWQDWSVALSAEHKFSADWSISGEWLNAWLVGSAAHSPLARSRFQSSLSLSLWRRL